MIKNHYKTLGVSPKATIEQIKKAYRKIVKKNHPDKNPDNPVALRLFREATEAYDVISNEKERLAYNKRLKAQVERQLQDIYKQEQKKKSHTTQTNYTYDNTRKEAKTGFETSNRSFLGMLVGGITLTGMALILLKRKLKRLKRDI